jgi:hypothetical protein
MDTSGKMLRRIDRPLLRRALLLALGLLAPGLTAAAEDIPRTPWGAPDLNGVWDFGIATPFERPENLAGKTHFSPEEAAAYLEDPEGRLEATLRQLDGEDFVGVELWIPSDLPLTDDLRTSQIVDPPDGKIPPRTPDAQAAFEAGGAKAMLPPDGPEDRPINERCILGFSTGPPVFGFFGYNSLLQIFQTEDTVAILMEMVNDSRIIPLVEKPHLPENVRQWKGDSRGYWDGDTLVVETRNFRPDTSFQGSGPGMVLTERFTRRNASQIEYEYTVNDPASFTAPWTVRYPFNRTEDPLYEYACHEYNESMTSMLRAARMDEAD